MQGGEEGIGIVDKFLRQGSLYEDIQFLQPVVKAENAVARYRKSKIRTCLLVAVVCLFLGVILLVSQRERNLSSAGEVVREAAGGERKQLLLRARNPLSQRMEQFAVEIAPTELSEEEFVCIFEKFCEKAEELIAGENVNLDEVSKNLFLQESYEGYPFEVRWDSDRPDLIDASGRLCTGGKGGIAVLYGEVVCGEWSDRVELTVRILPTEMSEEDVHELVLEELLMAEKMSRNESKWTLPKEIGDYPMEWTEQIPQYGWYFVAAAPVTAVLVFFLADYDLHKKAQEQRKQMRKEYPLIVHKLVLYVGAGLSVSNAFEIIGREIAGTDSCPGKTGPGYEAVLQLCRQLHTGSAETAVYEKLGRLAGVREYMGLGTLLAQNSKRGNAFLLERLREEIEKTNKDSILRHRKMGEEAGTKLLLPTVLLLAVTLLMIMIPALESI